MVDRPDPRPRQPGKAALAALSLAQGTSIRQTAKTLGIGERTIRRWLKTSPAFKGKVESLRHEYIDATVGRLAAASSAAAGVLVALMAEGNTDTTRLAAAKAIIDKLPVITEFFDLSERVRALESRTDEGESWRR